ncbi:MAG: flagellar assembly peptidoglycan hydrolase FlgJ [Candidatus Competibacteraceae bacterium]|nr:flagellar assembly peptidoglycan hydrolase FlgJ [Candidatus Competibacteraceae bacterium]
MLHDPTVQTDFTALTRLKTQARQQSSQALPTVARQFEAVFLQMMLKSMRQAGGGQGGLMDNDQSLMYRQMYDQQLAGSLADQGGIGIADMLVRQLGGEAARPRPVAPIPLAVLRQVEQAKAAMPQADKADEVKGQISRADTVSRPMELPPAPFKPGSPEAFVRHMWSHARQAAQDLGVDPAVLIAQAALETGWGRSVPRFPDGQSSHNLFGIKAHGGWRGEKVVNSTLEFQGGAFRRQLDGFRAYRSFGESFQDYVDFLRANPRYREALAAVDDGPTFLRELQRAGYATDPRYASKIQSILEGPVERVLDKLKLAGSGPISGAG